MGSRCSRLEPGDRSARVAFQCGLAIVAAAKSGKVTMRLDWRDIFDGAMEWGQEAPDLGKLESVFRKVLEEEKR